MRKRYRTILTLALCCVFLFPLGALGGPKAKSKAGPPAHAPAHGYRAKYNYHYYPGANVYYDTDRKIYFYMKGENWAASVSLPLDLKLQLGNHVSVEMDCDKPYLKN